MAILGSDIFIVTRTAAGSWVDGSWTDGVPTTFDLRGSLQPFDARAESMELLPEGARSQARWWLICDRRQSELRLSIAESELPADHVTIDGRDYVALAIQDWHRHTRGVPYRSYILGEVTT